MKEKRLSFQKNLPEKLSVFFFLWENRNWSWVFFTKFYEKSQSLWSLVWDSGVIGGLVELKNAC
jgi:hypothetical protein